LFGEDKFLLNCPNKYTVKVTSMKAEIMSIKLTDFTQSYKRMIEATKEYFSLRAQLIKNQLHSITKSHLQKGLTFMQYHIWQSRVKPEQVNWELIPCKTQETDLE
jgi:hypothetical protein